MIEKAPWDEIAPLGESFKTLTAQLEKHGISFAVKRRLVRGLDYYNGTVFEVSAEGLGAQDAVAGGGRYDRLVAGLGGSPAPCTGFSIGMERLLAVLDKTSEPLKEKLGRHRVYLAPLESGCEVLDRCRRAALDLRARGIRIETLAGETSLSRHLKKANQLGIRFVLVLGAEEVQKTSGP